MTDLLADHIAMISSSPVDLKPYLDSGKFKPLAVTGSVRSQQLPNVATIGETLKSPPVVTYNGLLAPGRTPDDIVVAIAHALSTPDRRVEFQERLVKVGAEPIVSTLDEFAKIIAVDTDLWRDIVRDLNLRSH